MVSKYVYSTGMMHMLMDTDLDVTQQDYVRTAQASGKALVSLINEVLDQAKIESGKIELEAVQFDLRAILDDLLSLASAKSQEKGVEVANTLPLTLVIHVFFFIQFCWYNDVICKLFFSFLFFISFESSLQLTSLIRFLRC